MAGHVPVPVSPSHPLAADPYSATEDRERCRPAGWRRGISRARHLARHSLPVPMDRSAPGDAFARLAVRRQQSCLGIATWRLAIGLATGAGGTELWASLGIMELEEPRALAIWRSVCPAISSLRNAAAWLCGLSPLRHRMCRHRRSVSGAQQS